MSFLHLSVLAGLAAVTIPVMLHLIGQRQPKLIDFPALRFVRQTTQEQSTSWQLRHILLLLLRVLLLAVIVLALARPRVHSAALGSILGASSVGFLAAFATLAAAIAFAGRRPASVYLSALVIAIALWLSAGLWGYRTITTGPVVPSSDQSAPVAAALIIDNGPTMAYRSADEMRLDKARAMGLWILDQLPIDSRVGLLTGAPIGSLSLDPSTAKTQVNIIEQRGAHVDLLSRVRTALDLVVANELERKEIYVVSDLMSSSWTASQADLTALLDEYSGQVLLQIIDVGSQDDANWQLGDAVPDFKSAAVGSDVTIELSVQRAAGATDETATVEMLREAIDPRLPVFRDGELQTPPMQVIDRQVLDFSNTDSVNVQLTAHALQQGSNNFFIKLNKHDPLEIDNVRYLSIPAYSQQPTLIVASDPAIGQLLKFVVDPNATKDPATGLQIAQQVPYVQLADVALEKFSVICLYDPPPLTSNVARKLDAHVRGGGSLLIILGPQVGDAGSAAVSPLAQLLPGVLSGPMERDPGAPTAFLNPTAISHPIFSEFGELAGDVHWNLFPVYRNWTFKSLAQSAQILMDLSDNRDAAVVSHSLGSGQVITFATPIPEPELGRRPLWNLLWASEDSIPAFGLLLGAFRSLSGADSIGADFQVGQIVNLRNDTRVWPSRYTLYVPSGRSRRVDSEGGQLLLGQFDEPGIYYLRGQRTEPVVRGISANVPAADTQLERLTAIQLDDLLGRDHYRIARDRDEVQSSVGQARFGRELYSLLITLVAGLFLAEQAMSNRFYKIKFSRATGAIP